MWGHRSRPLSVAQIVAADQVQNQGETGIVHNGELLGKRHANLLSRSRCAFRLTAAGPNSGSHARAQVDDTTASPRDNVRMRTSIKQLLRDRRSRRRQMVASVRAVRPIRFAPSGAPPPLIYLEVKH